MKVGIDVSSIIYGTGVSDYTLELVRHLPPEAVVPVGFSLRRQADIKRLLPSTTTYPIPPTLLHYLWNKLHIYNFENFAPGNIDVYHSSDWAQAPDSNPKVTTIHDLSPILYSSETHPSIVSAHSARLKWVERECDRIICVSKSTQADFIKLFPKAESRTVVIAEALPSRFLIAPKSHAPFQDYLLVIGARQPRKNISNLIAAYSQFHTKLKLPPKLVIVGETPTSPAHSHSENVLFTGYLSDQDLVTYLAHAKALVYPSLSEGFGLPILAAFHHQVPVACSDIPVFHETAGFAASFFDPLDLPSIAQGIASAIKHRSKQIQDGVTRLSNFSWISTAQATLKVYKSLC